MSATLTPAHQIVQFDHPVSAVDIAALSRAGANITAALPDNAVTVLAPGRLDPASLGASWMGPLDSEDKISPTLAPHIRERREQAAEAIVEFHSDVSRSEQDAAISGLRIRLLRPAALRPEHAIVQATAAEIRALSQLDEVAYIFPADPELLRGGSSYPCAGMMTTAGPVAQYANITHGWDVGADNIAHLTYYFSALTPKVPAATVQSEIIRALNQWASVVNVEFTPSQIATASRNIFIEFVSGAHGDGYPFDGPGGVLAHTFYPVPVNAEPIAGDMHFDADESWHSGTDTDIYTVALHEAGHAIGLSHSDNPGDVMYPYYHRGAPLSANDIGAARELYPPTQTITTWGQTTAMTLTLDPYAASTASAQVSLSGVVTGGTGQDTVRWQTNQGYSGSASVSANGSWSASAIELATGANTITLTATDAEDHTATVTASVTSQPTPVITASGPVAISISSPAVSVVTVPGSTMTITGTASGGAGIGQVTWLTTNGDSGIATGTSQWAATNIPIPVGTTTVILKAIDAHGASNWVGIVAVRH